MTPEPFVSSQPSLKERIIIANMAKALMNAPSEEIARRGVEALKVMGWVPEMKLFHEEGFQKKYLKLLQPADPAAISPLFSSLPQITLISAMCLSGLDRDHIHHLLTALLESGADPDGSEGLNKKTALHEAIYNGLYPTATLLSSYGANWAACMQKEDAVQIRTAECDFQSPITPLELLMLTPQLEVSKPFEALTKTALEQLKKRPDHQQIINRSWFYFVKNVREEYAVDGLKGVSRTAKLFAKAGVDMSDEMDFGVFNEGVQTRHPNQILTQRLAAGDQGLVDALLLPFTKKSPLLHTKIPLSAHFAQGAMEQHRYVVFDEDQKWQRPIDREDGHQWYLSGDDLKKAVQLLAPQDITNSIQHAEDERPLSLARWMGKCLRRSSFEQNYWSVCEDILKELASHPGSLIDPEAFVKELAEGLTERTELALPRGLESITWPGETALKEYQERAQELVSKHPSLEKAGGLIKGRFAHAWAKTINNEEDASDLRLQWAASHKIWHAVYQDKLNHADSILKDLDQAFKDQTLTHLQYKIALSEVDKMLTTLRGSLEAPYLKDIEPLKVACERLLISMQVYRSSPQGIPASPTHTTKLRV